MEENYSIKEFIEECSLNYNAYTKSIKEPGNIKKVKRVKKIVLNLDISDTIEKDAFFGIYVCECGAVNAIRDNPAPLKRVVSCGNENCRQTITIKKGGSSDEEEKEVRE